MLIDSVARRAIVVASGPVRCRVQEGTLGANRQLPVQAGGHGIAFQRVDQDEILAPYLERYLAAAETIWEDKGTQRASTALEYLFPRQLASQQLLDRVDAWLASTSANSAAQRYVREGRADVARALAAQARDARG